MPVAYHLDRSTGRSVRRAGGHARVLATAEHTDGALSVVEGLLPVGTRLPVHTHEVEDVSVYVLEGELEMRSGSTCWSLGAGSFALLPRQVPHAIRSIGPWAARVVWTVWPSVAADAADELASVLALHGACATPTSACGDH
jgi:quercetin dioxygenase-like cupin family protein